jgi:hypothetical protein
LLLPVLVIAFAVDSEVGQGIKTRRAAASTLPKAGVQPEGRKDKSIGSFTRPATIELEIKKSPGQTPGLSH